MIDISAIELIGGRSLNNLFVLITIYNPDFALSFYEKNVRNEIITTPGYHYIVGALQHFTSGSALIHFRDV